MCCKKVPLRSTGVDPLDGLVHPSHQAPLWSAIVVEKKATNKANADPPPGEDLLDRTNPEEDPLGGTDPIIGAVHGPQVGLVGLDAQPRNTGVEALFAIREAHMGDLGAAVGVQQTPLTPGVLIPPKIGGMIRENLHNLTDDTA